MDLPPAHLPHSDQPTSPSAKAQAITLTSQRKFHQIFTLPETSTHGRLKVTYAIAGQDLDHDVPTILFCGGMFGTRWMALWQDWFAVKEGVRILFIDRPGFGGSTPVPVTQRLSIFLETTVALLAHLRIPHIALASHSAGTIYAFNLISHHPELLSPSNPTLTLMSPWVHQSISGMRILQAAAMLPDVALSSWDSIIGTAVTWGPPTLQFSSGVLGKAGSLFQSASCVECEDEGSKKAEEERKCKEAFGFGTDVKKELEAVALKFTFAESMKGGNDEARFCLRSVAGLDWDRCEDYPVFVRELKQTWEKTSREGGAKLKLSVFYCQGEDIMIGKKGRKYFEECWEKENVGEGIEVVMSEEKGTDHDSITEPDKGVMKKIFDMVKAGLGRMPNDT